MLCNFGSQCSHFDSDNVVSSPFKVEPRSQQTVLKHAWLRRCWKIHVSLWLWILIFAVQDALWITKPLAYLRFLGTTWNIRTTYNNILHIILNFRNWKKISRVTRTLKSNKLFCQMCMCCWEWSPWVYHLQLAPFMFIILFIGCFVVALCSGPPYVLSISWLLQLGLKVCRLCPIQPTSHAGFGDVMLWVHGSFHILSVILFILTGDNGDALSMSLMPTQQCNSLSVTRNLFVVYGSTKSYDHKVFHLGILP